MKVKNLRNRNRGISLRMNKKLTSSQLKFNSEVEVCGLLNPLNPVIYVCDFFEARSSDTVTESSFVSLNN